MALLIIIFVTNKERTTREKLFCLSWFLFLMAPAMFFRNRLIDYLDHRFFLPLIGILIFLLLIFSKKFFETVDIKKIYPVIIAFVLICSLTLIRSRHYSGPITFYNWAVSQNPNSALAYNMRGNIKDTLRNYKALSRIMTRLSLFSPNMSRLILTEDLQNYTWTINSGLYGIITRLFLFLQDLSKHTRIEVY